MGGLPDSPCDEVVLEAQATCEELALLDDVGVTPRGFSALGLPLDVRAAACCLDAMEADAAQDILPILLMKDAPVVSIRGAVEAKPSYGKGRRRFGQNNHASGHGTFQSR